MDLPTQLPKSWFPVISANIWALEFFQEFPFTLSRFFQGNRPHRDRDTLKKRQCNGPAVTCVVAPIQVGTVLPYLRNSDQ